MRAAIAGVAARRDPGASAAGPLVATALVFATLFAEPIAGLLRDWWVDPDAGHGLLLAPLALWLMWRAPVQSPARPAPVFGAGLLSAAILLRFFGGVAAELYSQRLAVLMALVGLVVFYRGHGQVRRWWLPLTLLFCAIPLPALVTNALALPLQFRASAMGTSLLRLRGVPVELAGNVILLPRGHQLFVTEACSGLRSLTALLSLGVLLAGLFLQYPVSRLVIVALAIPTAIAINAIRIFLTAFLVYYVSPTMGEGFMHLSEGWLLFLVAFALLGLMTWMVAGIERRHARATPRD